MALDGRSAASLDEFWLHDESLGASQNRPERDVLVGEFAKALRAALA